MITVIAPDVWLPNAFTPGGNGRNDVFYVRGKGIENFEFAIFNRWGEQVFYSKDMNMGWNGTKQPTGEELQEGAYIYIVKGELSNGDPVNMKGLVNLIR
jgi:gliding motility-associated-like protein